MASGSVHAAIASLALVAVPVALAIWTDAPIVPVAVGMAIGWFITPDMDVDGGTHEEQRWLIGPVLRVIFWPYAKAFKHRGISHWPIFGTLTRLLYLFGPAWLLCVALGVTWPTIEPRYLWWALGGWAAQDTLHWVLDWVF